MGVLDASNLQLFFFPPAPVSSQSFAGITELNLDLNSLTTIPSCIYECVSLEKLKLSGNSVHNISSMQISLVAQKCKLRSLDLSNNNISTIPNTLSSIESLSELNLCQNKLLSPLQFLSGLLNLRVLKVSKALFWTHDLPTGFSELIRLEELYASANELKSISDSIVESWAPSLRVLDLSCNALKFHTKFPLLTKLEVLKLRDNQLEALPLRIAFMTSLVELDISQNKIKELTPALGSVVTLQKLAIEKNPLKSVPPTIGLLTRLQLGYFTHDESLFPVDLTTTGEKLASLREPLRRQAPFFRAKIIVLGRENVGKTVLMQCLLKTSRRHADNLKSYSTDGVDISQWNFNYKKEDQTLNITVSVWDFAGQIIHTNTHQFFLSDRAVYVLVWKIPLGDMACRVHYWLENISTSAKNALVFIVGTHLDSADMSDKQLDAIKKKYEKLFPSLQLRFHIVSNTTKDGLSQLRKKIQEAIVNQPHMGDLYPATFSLLESQIKIWRGIPPIIKVKDWEFTAKCCFIHSDPQLEVATQLFTDFGMIVRFPKHPLLKDFIITDPGWLPKIMSTVFTEKHRWVHDGFLRVSDLTHIWKAPLIPPHLHSTLLHLFSLFNIATLIESAMNPFLQLPPNTQVQTTMVRDSRDKSEAAAVKSKTPSPKLSDSNSGILSTISASAPSPSLISAPSSPIPGNLTVPDAPTPISIREVFSRASTLTLRATEQPSASDDVLLEQPLEPIVAVQSRLDQDSLVLLPSLLPMDTPTSLDTIWPAYHKTGDMEIGRQFQFQYIPDGLFSRFIVALATRHKILTIWRNGFVLESTQEPPNPPVKYLIQQDVEQNTITIRLRFNTEGRPGEYMKIGPILQEILENLGCEISSWFKVNVASSAICPQCLRSRKTKYFLFSSDVIEQAVNDGTQEILCNNENAMVPVVSIVPDKVTHHLKTLHTANIQWDQLEVKGVIGEGAVATVYQALWKGELVAAKLFKLEKEGIGCLAGHPPAYDLSCKVVECRRELQVMSLFNHPNILRIIGLVTQPLCLVMEFLDGGNLHSYLHTDSIDISWQYRLKLATDVARAMAALHNNVPPIIHRDLKSPNVLLRTGDPPTAVLCDFGLSGEFSLATIVAENPVWVAPEALRGEKFTLECDVYAFGVICWELASRQDYFGELKFLSEIADAVVEGRRPAIPSDTPVRFKQLIEQCWCPDPAARLNFSQILDFLYDTH